MDQSTTTPPDIFTSAEGQRQLKALNIAITQRIRRLAYVHREVCGPTDSQRDYIMPHGDILTLFEGQAYVAWLDTREMRLITPTHRYAFSDLSTPDLLKTLHWIENKVDESQLDEQQAQHALGS